jgi:HAD superfamily hydrolase (TIGR01484 family)
MKLPIKLISTDFDGTLHSDFEVPPVPVALKDLLARLQSGGVKWVVNTGRDLSGLLEGMARAGLTVQPDYIVAVERELYEHREDAYLPVTAWNHRCQQEHAVVFAQLRRDLPELTRWVHERFTATVYEDPYSPFCLLAGNNRDTDQVQEYLENYCRQVPHLAVVRNDVYLRFCHQSFNKGSALTEIARLVGVSRREVFAVGDHFNDLPMLNTECAAWLAAPANAMPEVRNTVNRQGGFVSSRPCGSGVLEALEKALKG